MMIYYRPRLLTDNIIVDKEVNAINVQGIQILNVNNDCDYVISSINLPYSNEGFADFDKIVVTLIKIDPTERIGNNEQCGEV